MLERHADPSGGWWELAFGRGGWDAQALRHLLDPPDRAVLLPALAGSEERRRILAAVIERAGSVVRPPVPGADPAFDRQLADLSWGGEPLFLMMAGLTAARAGFGHVLALARTDLAFTIADSELNRIKGIAGDSGVNADFLVHIAAYVTLCRGLGRTAIEEAIDEEKEALRRQSAGDPPDIADALNAALPGEGGTISPILPDMVGEAVILRVFNRLAREAQLEAVSRASRRARARVAATAIRIAQDYSLEGYQAPLDWADQMVQENASDLAGLAEIVGQIPLNTLVLRDRAAAIYAIIGERARQFLSLEDNEQTRALLASSLNNLAPYLSELGRREEALTVAQEAVAILAPYFLGRPLAFVQWMATMVKNYLDLIERLDREPDAALLHPIFEAFEALESGARNEPEG